MFGDKNELFLSPFIFIIKLSFICLISPPSLYYLHYHLYYFHFGLSSYQLMTFRPLFTNYNFVLKYCTISGFLNFHFSYLIYEKFNLCLQNTLNMSKTTRVYFGVLQSPLFDNSLFIFKRLVEIPISNS